MGSSANAYSPAVHCEVRQRQELQGAEMRCRELAGVDGNRTHQGRDTPPIGFEDRARHQATNYSLTKLQANDVASPFQGVHQLQHIRDPADGQGILGVKILQAKAA